MAQSYFTPSAPSQALSEPSSVVQTASDDVVDKIASSEDVQNAYNDQKNRLVNAIDDTKSILIDYREFNKDEWTVRYPRISPAPTIPDNTTTSSPPPSTSSTFTGTKKNSHFRRSLSFVDEPEALTDVIVTPNKNIRTGLQRSVTLSSIADVETASLAGGSETEVGSNDDSFSDAETLIDPSVAADFRVLRLDLKLGAPGSSASSTNTSAALVSQLEKASIANLLDERIASAISHIDNLRTRVEDTSSKVLVTGDLNAGKSTFVNALLGRQVMPVDQQPCTTLFCEVHDSTRENEGVEELHVVREGATYDRLDESTFDRHPLQDLERLVAEHEDDAELNKVPVKLYVSDPRSPNTSLLNNGTVSISLIDAPGLNRDSLKTTALFARQSEIDVVVFVVSAENHFTLSAKEFLWNAANEKAYLFIVVNRFDSIRDKDKCRRVVLEQIRQLSPHTWEEREDLVHFVDSSSALARGLLRDSTLQDGNASNAKAGVETQEMEIEMKMDPAFAKLESDLRSFVLVKRTKSKLLPASTYLSHILSDIDLLSSSNAILAQSEIIKSRETLERSRPILEGMIKGKEALEEGLVEEEEGTTRVVGERVERRLERALERVGRGEIGVVDSDLLTRADLAVIYPSSSSSSSSSSSKLSSTSPIIPTMPTYPGLLGIWEYTQNVRLALLASLDLAVKLAEDEARVYTSRGVGKVGDLGERYLPPQEGLSGVGGRRERRVFRPEAMFVPRLRSSTGSVNGASGKAAKHSKGRSSLSGGGRGAIVAGGTQGLGIGLIMSRPDLTEVSFVDILDFQHHFLVHFGDHIKSSSSKSYSSSSLSGEGEEEDEDESTASLLSTLGLGLGAIMMVGGKTLGARGLLEGVLRLAELFGDDGIIGGIIGGNGSAKRKWVAPVLGAIGIGASVWFVLELPRSVPRTVGRRVRAELLRRPISGGGGGGGGSGAASSTSSSSLSSSASKIGSTTHSHSRTTSTSSSTLSTAQTILSLPFIASHTMRITRETRKVLRLATWDARFSFNSTMEASEKEVKGAEESERRGLRAREWFESVLGRTEGARVGAGVSVGVGADVSGVIEGQGVDVGV